MIINSQKIKPFVSTYSLATKLSEREITNGMRQYSRNAGRRRRGLCGGGDYVGGNRQD